MKKLWLLVLMVLGVSGCATTHHAWTEKVSKLDMSGQKRVAIFQLNGDMTGAVADALTTELMGMGFEVVERSSLNAILKEMKLDYSGALDSAQRKEVARASDANAIVFGSVQTTYGGNIYFMDLRFVDIATGEILWSMNYVNDNFENPRKSMKEMTRSIREGINRPVTATKLDKMAFGEPRLSVAQSPVLHGKKYKKVALLKLGGTNFLGEGNAAYGALVTDLIGNGVEMVERKDLDSILKEHSDAQSGLYNQFAESKRNSTDNPNEVNTSTSILSKSLSLSKQDLSEITHLTGADALLIGSFQPQIYNPFTFTFANLRVLDLETGKIAWSASYYNTDTGPENYIYTADWLSIAISPLITSDNAADFAKKNKETMLNRKSQDSSIIETLVPDKTL